MIINIHRIGWFIGLVLLQVLILNSVHIAESLIVYILPAMLLLFSISILF